jgi:hypothetical protein
MMGKLDPLNLSKHHQDMGQEDHAALGFPSQSYGRDHGHRHKQMQQVPSHCLYEWPDHRLGLVEVQAPRCHKR